MSSDDYCIGCGTELRFIDRDPNGEKNSDCARCRAEDSHDFDKEPSAVFSRFGVRMRVNKAKLQTP